MAKVKDKLEKIKIQKLNPIDVIHRTGHKTLFCYWIAHHFDNLVNKRIFSLKRLARMFLKENPDFYFEYKTFLSTDKETMRIIQDKSCWEND